MELVVAVTDAVIGVIRILVGIDRAWMEYDLMFDMIGDNETGKYYDGVSPLSA